MSISRARLAKAASSARSIVSGCSTMSSTLACSRKQLEMAAAASVLAGFVSHEVGRDGEKPGAFAHDRLLARGPQEGLLRHLFSPVAVAQPPRQVSDERLVIVAEEAVEVDHWLNERLVERAVWKGRCGKGGVETAAWKQRRGNSGVETAAWKQRVETASGKSEWKERVERASGKSEWKER